MKQAGAEAASRTWRDIPRSVVALGMVSLLMDVSSELIHGLLPIFLTTVIGTSTLVVGVIEGVSEATVSITKVFSGAISDRIGKRKLLVAMGYGLAALSKPFFPLAGTASEILVARFIDRVGKGIREAPRDALIADVTPSAIRGASYGLRQALDTIGAVAGPLIAVALMTLYSGNFRAVFWWALLPALLAVFVLVIGVAEPSSPANLEKSGWPIRRKELARMPRAYWTVVAIGAVFGLARFSEAFLLLKAQAEGLALALVPLVFVWMNLVYAIVAAPAGILSDKIGRKNLLLCGLGTLTIADLVLAWLPGLGGTAAGIGLWGLYLGLSQGLLSALVADTAPNDLRGTAFGLFNLVGGVALLAANALAGWAWHEFGSAATFALGAGISLFAMLMTEIGLRGAAAPVPAR